ncbi:MAG TPA: hypothetical protein VD704_12235 [Gaiellaceae bacterium]|nr:hypothetical protein [Gaiellaceae bacterium]
MARLPLSPTSVWGVVKELKAAAEDFRPLLVGGAPGTARALRDTLVEGGDPGAVRDISGGVPSAYDLEGAAVLVYAVEGGAPSEEDERALRLAGRKDVETVVVVVDAPPGEQPAVPYVLDTDVVAVGPGEPLPLETILKRVAERADERAHLLAGRLPALRPAVVDAIVKRFAVQNGVLGVAIFIPGADFPVLTLNQIRMVLRIASAHGEELDRERALEVLSVVAAGLGFRTVARHLVGSVPGFGWALKGGIAYGATLALGEAATAYFGAGGARRLAGSVRSRS